MNHVPALYSAKPTLAELYADDATLFSSMQLPTSVQVSDVGNFLLLKFGELETIFPAAAAAKSAFNLWSATRVDNWSRILEALSAEYAPLENYDMTETMTNDETVTEYGKTSTRTDNLSHTKTGTETTTPNLTETTTPNLSETETPNETNTVDRGVFGFNSETAEDDNTTTETRTGTNTRTQTGTETRATTGTSTLQHNTTDANTGTETTADSGSDTATRNYTLTRHGNIGVTTSQQMLESELALRCRWNLFEIIGAEFQHEFCVSVW